MYPKTEFIFQRKFASREVSLVFIKPHMGLPFAESLGRNLWDTKEKRAYMTIPAKF